MFHRFVSAYKSISLIGYNVSALPDLHFHCDNAELVTPRGLGGLSIVVHKYLQHFTSFFYCYLVSGRLARALILAEICTHASLYAL